MINILLLLAFLGFFGKGWQEFAQMVYLGIGVILVLGFVAWLIYLLITSIISLFTAAIIIALI